MRAGLRIVVALVSGACSAVAIPPGPVWWLAWVGPALLVVALHGASVPVTILLGVAYAVTLGVGNVGPWMAPAVARYFGLPPAEAVGLTIAGLAGIGIVHGIGLGILLVLAAPTRGRFGAVRFGAAWVVWEAGRTLVVPYFPTAILGTSQVDTPLLAVARFAGIAGVGFLIATWSAALARSLLAGRRGGGRLELAAASLAVVTAATIAARGLPVPTPPSRATIVLGLDVGARSPGEARLATQLEHTVLDQFARPDLVLWPESAIEVDLERDHAAFLRLKAFVDASDVSVLTGGPGSVRTGRTFARFNSIHLLPPGHGLSSYHKRQLMPLAESWPGWLGSPPSTVEYVSAGTTLPLFTLPDGARFGTLVCFEIADASAMRDLLHRGADFLVNPTNDSWFPDPDHLPHVVWARVRAVETGLPVVRVANAGPSGIIGPDGRWTPVDHPTAESFRGEVPAANPTPHPGLANVLVAICAALLAAGAVARAMGAG